MERAILREDWMRAGERLTTEVFLDSEDISSAVAAEVAALVRRRQEEGRPAVLGLATGSTPMHVYRELVRMHREEGLSFSNVVTFNLDEYWPMDPGALQSYHRFMREHLFDHVDVPPEAVHIPDGTVPLADVPRHCCEYEAAIEAAGSIDLQLLGLGRGGHIGFNERGSSAASATRLTTLDKVTRVDAASDFFGERNVPRRAITMGVATIMRSRRILLLAFGENKAAAVAAAVEGPVTPQLPASFLQSHPAAVALLDYAAAAKLTRVASPWQLGPVRWDEAQVKKAACWLSHKVGKPLLKLTDDDYAEHSLQDLVSGEWGPAYVLNLRVFHGLQRTMSGWPGGKPSNAAARKQALAAAASGNRPAKPGSLIPQLGASSDASSASCPHGGKGGQASTPLHCPGTSGGEAGQTNAHHGGEAGLPATDGDSDAGDEEGSAPHLPHWFTDTGLEQEGFSSFPKRVLVMSPHPDDDVISMGGTLTRLLGQGHEVHVAYQTSGNIAVWDEDALRFADFAVQFGAAMGLDASRTAEVAHGIEAALRAKRPGEVDSEAVLRTKALIRQCEARSAGRTCGADVANLHFLNMPFYQTGRVVKAPLGPADIALLVNLFDRIRPHLIFAAGDLSDPHGTHRTCLQAIFRALEDVRHRDWYSACSTTVLLYRGAWQEWEPWEVDLAVLLSPAELERKVEAIWKHQSQKDPALFPGADPREFWQRAQDRNHATAALYDSLGLACYEAMEAFVRYDPHHPSPAHLLKPPAAADCQEQAAIERQAAGGQEGEA